MRNRNQAGAPKTSSRASIFFGELTRGAEHGFRELHVVDAAKGNQHARPARRVQRSRCPRPPHLLA